MAQKSNKKTPRPKIVKPSRNGNIFDRWSVIHCATGVIFGWIMTPFIALVIMVLWEPLEILVLSPILARYNIIFGFESLRNSLSDIFFDTLGVIIGAYALTEIATPPFHLF